MVDPRYASMIGDPALDPIGLHARMPQMQNQSNKSVTKGKFPKITEITVLSKSLIVTDRANLEGPLMYISSPPRL